MEMMYFFVEIMANFIEAFVCYKFLELLIGQKRKLYTTILLASIQSIIICIFQTEDLFSNILIFLVTLSVSIIMCLFYKINYGISLTVCAIYYINIVALSELSSLILVGLFTKQEFIGRLIIDDMSLIRATYILSIKLIQISIYWVLKKNINSKRTTYPILKQYWKIILPINIISYLCILFLIQHVASELTSDLVINWFSYLIFFSLCIISLFFYLKLKKNNERKENIEIRNKTLEQNYNSLRQILDSQAKFSHDLSSHLNILYRYANKNDAHSIMSYIEGIRKPFISNTMEIWTGNEIVDFILNKTSVEANEKNVIFSIETKPCEISIPDRDINSLLTNVLENALDAATKDNTSERFIDFKLNTANKILIIQVKNNYVGNIKKKGNRILTNKDDKKKHGYGIEIIRDIVEKYDGCIDISYEKQIFQLLIELSMDFDS